MPRRSINFPTDRRRVLILCTGNSARSQMAEALTNRHLSHHWKAYSAGSRPVGYVHPLAVKAMAEVGIDISRRRSKPVEEFRYKTFDLVITICDGTGDSRPTWLSHVPWYAISFPDPTAAMGSKMERLARFCEIRDALSQELLPFLEQWEAAEDKASLEFAV